MTMPTVVNGRRQPMFSDMARRIAGMAATLSVTGLLLAGCNTLPRSGPEQSEIVADQKSPKKNSLGFRIIPITPELISWLDAEKPPLLSTLDTTNYVASHNDRIGPGDHLAISVYEVGNGLFAGSVSGTSTKDTSSLTSMSGIGGDTPLGAIESRLPVVQVNDQGNITIPYAGKVHVAGLTPSEIEQRIASSLKNVSTKPAVVVRPLVDETNVAIVYGDVAKTGRIPLSPNQERVLDVVALAGGAKHLSEDVLVQLTRGDRLVQAPLKLIEQTPEQDIPLQPGDRLELLYEPRSFTVFGATAKVDEVDFTTPTLSLAEGLSRVGGPLDQQADPNAVYLFRFEDRNIASRLGLQMDPGQQNIPVVYQLDMMNAQNYFLAQQFPMKNKDLIYVANAKINNFNKFFNLLSTIISPGITAAWLAK
ncbi:polysaccharide biosynthesis/export family protein [Novacetimonas pomaceti]|uniref:polysaccharide biosynthesis/export family protein n=1 Tax=Novacetimonas pomaceti TaxID=2021998 RepID=UPI001EF03531|nr:polysaccharide biosynthesis/export family protein [Novacetimonas pomaceti]